MKRLLGSLALSLGALVSTVDAQSTFSAGGFSAAPDTAFWVFSELEGASGDAFILLAAPHQKDGFDLLGSFRVGLGKLDSNGRGEAGFYVNDLTGLPPGTIVDVAALYVDDQGQVILTDDAEIPLTLDEDCNVLDMDFAIGIDEPVAGQIIDDEWALIGLQISAVNNNAAHPDLAIIFDSANPTGGDDDLRTPGDGLGNDEALGNLLIIPENDNDGDGDGLVDNPDDEKAGGTLTFEFDDPSVLCAITLVDIDDNSNSKLVFTLEDSSTQELDIVNAGNNSVQTLSFLVETVVRLDVVFGGSGGVADLQYIPCPYLFFDESTTGIPNGFPAGTWITDQYVGEYNVLISAENNVPGHPDKAILFDSANPTGGDDDLRTPGDGVDNTVALGMLLIIAEDDVDGDGDGLVDDPDDEAGGGTFFFDYEEDVVFQALSVLDVDGGENDFVAAFDELGNELMRWELQMLGDNSAQRVVADPPLTDVRRVIVTLGGSGAVTNVTWCPDNRDDEEERN